MPRSFFEQITGSELDDEPFAGFVEDIIQTLAYADIDDILRDFGKRGRRSDPVVHFYETFLHAYDPKLRELRGVYYTPEPVVNYIVESIDGILNDKFKLKDGLADRSKVKLAGVGAGSAGVGAAVSAAQAVGTTASTTEKHGGRVWINDRQYFEGIAPTVWNFPIGGYLPAQRWLKDCIGRTLSFEDMSAYARIISALAETGRLMQEIDVSIATHGGWPQTFSS